MISHCNSTEFHKNYTRSLTPIRLANDDWLEKEDGHQHGDEYSLAQAQILISSFVVGDIFSFMTQSTGAGVLMKKGQDARCAGHWITTVVLQLIFFGFFMAVAINFREY